MRWKLLITRETDLFERYLRVAGYRDMLGNASRFKIKNLLVVNNDGLTAQYVYVPEIQNNQKILWEEYRRGKLEDLIKFWQQIISDLKPAADRFKSVTNKTNFERFLHYYSLARGIVFYTDQLSKLIETKKKFKDIKTLGHWHELAETESSQAWDSLKKKFVAFSYYLPFEFERFLANKKGINKSVLEQRKRYYILLMRESKIGFYLGKKAKQIEAKELTQERIEVTDFLKGKIASSGCVKGKVRIVNTTTQMKQMKKGEILISIMTTPRLMPAAKKAKAIITDEGGITCHAAIVSRELGIPCIIGTKIATRVLKDGDMVEVDANKGIVKLVNSK